MYIYIYFCIYIYCLLYCGNIGSFLPRFVRFFLTFESSIAFILHEQSWTIQVTILLWFTAYYVSTYVLKKRNNYHVYIAHIAWWSFPYSPAFSVWSLSLEASQSTWQRQVTLRPMPWENAWQMLEMSCCRGLRQNVARPMVPWFNVDQTVKV